MFRVFPDRVERDCRQSIISCIIRTIIYYSDFTTTLTRPGGWQATYSEKSRLCTLLLREYNIVQNCHDNILGQKHDLDRPRTWMANYSCPGAVYHKDPPLRGLRVGPQVFTGGGGGTEDPLAIQSFVVERERLTQEAENVSCEIDEGVVALPFGRSADAECREALSSGVE